MTNETITGKYCSIRLDDQLCFPLYACAKEVVRLYRKPLEKQGNINRTRPENNENKLFLSLTEQGDALRNKAIDVPREMDGCIPLSDEELIVLKNLLDKALVGMDHKAQEKA